MPFKSEAQRKYLWANEPKIARDWTDTYGSRIHKEDGGNIRLQPHEPRDLLVGAVGGTGRPKYQPPGQESREPEGRSEAQGGQFGSSYGPGRDTGWSPGVGGTQHIPTHRPDPKPTPDRFTGGGIRNINPTINPYIDKGPSTLDKFKEYIFGVDDDDYSIPSNLVADVSQSDIDILGKYAPNQELDLIKMMEKGLNPTITDQEIKDVLQKKITEPTGKFAAEGGMIGSVGGISRPKYQQGNMVGAEMEGAEMEGAMIQSQEVIKELYDALIAQGLSPQEAMEKIKQIIASTQTQEPESPMMGEEFPGQEFGRAPAAFGGIMDTYTGRRKYKLGSLKEKLEKYAPEGESLAFINKEEADLLKSRGGYGRPVNESGIPSFLSLPNPFKVVKKAVKKLTELASSKFGKIALGYLAGAGLSNYLAGTGWGLGSPAQSWSKMKWLDPRNIASNVGKSWGKLPFNQASKTAFNTTGTTGWNIPAEAYKDTLGEGWMKNPLKHVNLEKADFIPKVAQGLEGAKKSSLIPGIPNKILAGVAGPSIAAGLYTAAQPPEELGGEVTGEYDEDLQKWKDYYAGLGADYSIDPSVLVAQGGRVGRQEGGLMNLGGMEKDYRNDGGFVPLGGEEKADDVPARLSRNEFVFTADAVRNAGGGDIDRGAEVMENVMKNLEAGGQVSEESQGQGAQEMFEVSERLSEVV